MQHIHILGAGAPAKSNRMPDSHIQEIQYIGNTAWNCKYAHIDFSDRADKSEYQFGYSSR